MDLNFGRASTGTRCNITTSAAAKPSRSPGFFASFDSVSQRLV